jgi:RNA polymerase sigma-70 factor (ECF subfamily)
MALSVTFGQAIGMAVTAEDELERAVRDHARVVFQIAYSVLRNHADAEDATQEVFLRAVKHRGKLHEIEDPKAWLARIAWRVAIDRKRARIPAAAAFADDEQTDLVLDRLCAPGAPADAVAATRQMLSVTEQLVASLPDDLRQVAVLSTVDELTTREVSTVLGVPEATVRTRLFRARQLLREKLTARLAPRAQRETGENAGEKR